MSGKLFIRSGTLEKLLDRISQGKLILWGFISIFLFCGVLSLTLIMPLNQRIEESLDTRTSLEQEIRRIESEQAARSKIIPQSSDLPEVLDKLQEIYLTNALIVEEVLINQLPSASNASFDQSVIRLTIGGERSMVLKAVTETLTLSRYPFSIQELEINEQKAVIHLNIMLTKTASIP